MSAHFLKISRILLEKRFIRFLLVGGLNTAFGYGIFALFIFIGIHYTIAAFLSSAAGITFSFFTTGRLVFNNRDNRLIFKFVSVYGLLYLFNVAGLKLGLILGYNEYISGAVLLLPSALLAYLLQKIIVFRPKEYATSS